MRKTQKCSFMDVLQRVFQDREMGIFHIPDSSRGWVWSHIPFKKQSNYLNNVLPRSNYNDSICQKTKQNKQINKQKTPLTALGRCV